MENRIAADAVAVNQEILDELKNHLEYDDRKPPNWHGMIGHFNTDGDAVIIASSYASPREGCNQERLQIMPAKKGGVSLSGWDERGRSIDRHLPEINMNLALEKVLSGVRSGHRSGEWFANYLMHGDVDVDWLSQ